VTSYIDTEPVSETGSVTPIGLRFRAPDTMRTMSFAVCYEQVLVLVRAVARSGEPFSWRRSVEGAFSYWEALL
jgi:hypothetical protein